MCRLCVRECVFCERIKIKKYTHYRAVGAPAWAAACCSIDREAELSRVAPDCRRLPVFAEEARRVPALASPAAAPAAAAAAASASRARGAARAPPRRPPTAAACAAAAAAYALPGEEALF